MSERYKFVEIPMNPINEKRWDWLLFHLQEKFPYHYYVSEDRRIKIKRVAKKKIMNYILDVSKEFLTKRQYLYFRLYYDSFPRMSIRELAIYFDKSYESVFRTLRRAKYSILKFVFENTKNKDTKRRVGSELEYLNNIVSW